MVASSLIHSDDYNLETLQEREFVLENKVRDMDNDFSGLKDVKLIFQLINTKLSIAITLLQSGKAAGLLPGDRDGQIYEPAGKKAVEGVGLFEELTGQNVSIDQVNIFKTFPGFQTVKENLKKILLLGGGAFFENRITDQRISGNLATVINKAIRKYISPDDKYEQLFKTEKLPGFLRRLVNKFLPVLAKENQKPPPYGIEEREEEEICYSDQIKMPLSQAVYYLENEVLPHLEVRLEENPGDMELQERIRITKEKISEYRTIEFTPKARPFVPEKGYYTDAFSTYTADGELMVSMPVSVKFSSRTNMDRVQALVKDEIIRNIAGQGIVKELDEEYEQLKKIESGPRGNSRTPGMKLNTARLFPVVKRRLPVLCCIENKQDFLMLTNIVASGTRLSSIKYIRDLIEKGQETNHRLE